MTTILSRLRLGREGQGMLLVSDKARLLYRQTSAYILRIVALLPIIKFIYTGAPLPYDEEDQDEAAVYYDKKEEASASAAAAKRKKKKKALKKEDLHLTSSSNDSTSAEEEEEDDAETKGGYFVLNEGRPKKNGGGGGLSRSDSSCSCFSCSMEDSPFLPRRESRLLEGLRVEDFYIFHDKLGEGSFSTVYLAERRKVPVASTNFLAMKNLESADEDSLVFENSYSGGDGTLVAAKVISKSIIPDYDELLCLVDREIRILSELDHPHIVHLEEVYEEEDQICLIMELARGGEVFGRLLERGSFTERETANLLVQLIGAVSFCHDQGIVHRDLKLENILYMNNTPDSKIMVADFGLSEYTWENSETINGTPGYLAPEVICQKGYGPASDLWSIGVITYMILVGFPPFITDDDEDEESDQSQSNQDNAIMQLILKGEYSFDDPAWDNVSDLAKDFVRGLLTMDPNQRLTCEESLNHPWITNRNNLPATRKSEKELLHTDDGYISSSWFFILSQQLWNNCLAISFVFIFLLFMNLYVVFLLYFFNIDVDIFNDESHGLGYFISFIL